LKQARSIINVNSAKVLENIPAEPWARSDFSEGEADREDDKINSFRELDYILEESDEFQADTPISYSNTNDRRESSSPNSVNAARNVKYGSTTPGDTDDNTPQTDHISLVAGRVLQHDGVASQESTSLLFEDSHSSDEEMIEYFYEVACNGGDISLKSVDGERDGSPLW
jgi:hypothetical protein